MSARDPAAESEAVPVPARTAPQRVCIGRHLANRNEMRVSGFRHLRVAVLVLKMKRFQLSIENRKKSEIGDFG